MKNYIKKKLRSLLYFIELNFKLKTQSKNAIDKYYEKMADDCYDFFKKDMENSSIFRKVDDIRNFSIYKAYNNGSEKNLFLEFGVWKGNSINLFGKYLSRHKAEIYGFDSFEGLEEDWLTHEFFPKGSLSLQKKIPKVLNNVKLIEGKIQETLVQFLKKNSSKKIIFAHMDMDTYESTKYALEKIKPFLQKGSVILFDEFYGHPNWKKEEYKAFTEVFSEGEFKYIAFCENEVAIEVI
tara:strand:- start:511 stop:1224 length:714 start_codon:yes stop_codon:yes gene_type:complete